MTSRATQNLIAKIRAAFPDVSDKEIARIEQAAAETEAEMLKADPFDKTFFGANK
jgi:hypothetical protein